MFEINPVEIKLTEDRLRAKKKPPSEQTFQRNSFCTPFKTKISISINIIIVPAKIMIAINISGNFLVAVCAFKMRCNCNVNGNDSKWYPK